MVAKELSVAVEQVSQNDIDAAMLEALDDPIDTTPGTTSRVKKEKPAKAKKPRKLKAKTKTQDKHEKTIDRLKSYVAKCGVRKAWKRELDGLTAPEAIRRLEGILRELGMDGTIHCICCDLINIMDGREADAGKVRANKEAEGV